MPLAEVRDSTPPVARDRASRPGRSKSGGGDHRSSRGAGRSEGPTASQVATRFVRTTTQAERTGEKAQKAAEQGNLHRAEAVLKRARHKLSRGRADSQRLDKLAAGRLSDPAMETTYLKTRTVRANIVADAAEEIDTAAKKTRRLEKRIYSTPEGAIRATFGAEAENALRVADCESTMNPQAHRSGSQYYGLFQMGESEREAYGWKPDIRGQVEAAHRMYEARGWQPWSCASSLGIYTGSDALT